MITSILLALQFAQPGQLVITGRCVPGQLGACFSLEISTRDASYVDATGQVWLRTAVVVSFRNGQGDVRVPASPFSIGGLEAFWPSTGLAYDPNDPTPTYGPLCADPLPRSPGEPPCAQAGTRHFPDSGTLTLTGGASVSPPAPPWVWWAELSYMALGGGPIYGCTPDPSETRYYQTCGNGWASFESHTWGSWSIEDFTPTIAVSTSAGACQISGTAGSYGNTVECSVVPEPVTLLMVGTGLVGVAWIRRRRSANPSG